MSEVQMTDEQRKEHVAALVREQEGNDVRLRGAQEKLAAVENDDDPAVVGAAKAAVKKWESRNAQVDAELKRVRDTAKAPARRAQRQA